MKALAEASDRDLLEYCAVALGRLAPAELCLVRGYHGHPGDVWYSPCFASASGTRLRVALYQTKLEARLEAQGCSLLAAWEIPVKWADP